MKLKQKTTEYKDILPLSFHINYIGKDGALMIAGYPEIHYNRVASLGHLKESTSQYMYVKENCIEKVSQKKGEIVYTCPAWKGQDGGPVIGIDAYKRITIVGIHRGGVRANGRIVANVGRLVTEELIKTLQ